MTRTRTLKFNDLEFAKMRSYMELSNKVDAQLGEKFVKKLPLRIVVAFFTAGASIPFSAARQGYKAIKNANARNAVKAFVETERKLRNCEYVEWNSFPESHIVIGGPPMEREAKPTVCPLCKHCELRKFTADSDHEILSCSFCSRIIAVTVNRVTGISKEVWIPGVFVGAIPFTGVIEQLSDLAFDLGDLVADIAGSVLDLLA